LHNNAGSLDPSRVWFVEDHGLGRKESDIDTEKGEGDERRLNHSDGAAEKFDRELAAPAVTIRVGMEATGYSRSLAPKHLSEAIHYRTLDRTYWA
jgi:hypothetical protein